MTSPPRPDPITAELAAEFAAIAALLDSGPGPAGREEAKRRIIALFKRVDALLGELGTLREGIRGHVERYKQLAAVDAGAQAAGLDSDRPQLHHDHLGASTFVEKGWSLISLGDPQGAIQALGRALELSPDDIRAQSLLGWAQMLAEQHDDALATFSRVLAREPANALARVNVGFICLKKRIFGEAIEHLSRVIRLESDPKASLYANYYLGVVYLERAMYLDAQTFLRKALTLGPNLIEAYYDLGRAQWLNGDQVGARATWQQGAAANRFAPWAKRCRDLLESTARGEEVPRSSLS
jgi:tetratricopeptide (TPR) repeat protein